MEMMESDLSLVRVAHTQASLCRVSTGPIRVGAT